MQMCKPHTLNQRPLIPDPKFVWSRPVAGTNATTAQTVQLAKTPLGEPFFAPWSWSQNLMVLVPNGVAGSGSCGLRGKGLTFKVYPGLGFAIFELLLGCGVEAPGLRLVY